MNPLINEFENLKISALRKVKLVNEHIHNVTIGPNATYPELQISFENKNHTKTVNSKNNNAFEDTSYYRSCIEKLRNDLETEIHDEVQKSIEKRHQKLLAASNEFYNEANLAWSKNNNKLYEQTLKQEERILEALKEYDKKADYHVQQLKIELQRQYEERQRRNEQEVQKEKQRQQLLTLVETIQKKQQVFIAIYQEVVGCLKECPVEEAKNLLAKYSGTLKSFSDSIDTIREKCKAGTVTTTDLDQINLIVGEAKVLKEKTRRETALLKKEAELKKANEEMRIKIAAAKGANLASKSDESPGPIEQKAPDQTDFNKNTTNNVPEAKKQILSVVESFVSKTSLEMYTRIQKFSEKYVDSYKELLNDSNFKQFRFNCKKAVNIPLNTISSVSISHLVSKYQTLYNLLRGNPVEVAGSKVISSQHPQGIAYCTNLLAKKIVGQSDLITAESTHCYAAILVALWFDYPEFGNLVLAHFYEAVPYLVPMYPPKLKGQTDQEYYKSLGYLYTDGVREQQDKFLSRMTDYMRLYAAVIVTRLRKNQRGPHPHGLNWGWRWLASFLNLEPRVNITATLIFNFLEVAGNALQATYGIQFQKILRFLHDVYLPKIKKIDSGGPISRLEIFLQKIVRTNYIEPPKGRLPEGFW